MQFTLEQPGDMSLELLDELGRTTGITTSGYYESGDQQVRWNTVGLPGGVYFCRFRSATGVTYEKVVVPEK